MEKLDKHTSLSSRSPDKPSFSCIRFLIGLLVLILLVFGISYIVSEIPDFLDSKLGIGNFKKKNIIEYKDPRLNKSQFTSESTETAQKKNQKVLLTIGVLADSHNSNENLKKALDMSKDNSVDFIAFLGDFSDVGTLEELNAAKDVIESSELEYYAIPGDHDLWKSGTYVYFEKVFGRRYNYVERKGVKFFFIDNSDTSAGIDSEQYSWINANLELLQPNDMVFMFISNPVYNKNSFKLMGEHDPDVKKQADDLLKLIRDYPIKAVFYGDNHLSMRSPDPENKNLTHIGIGALADKRNLQTPRFSILTIYETGDYDVEEIVLSSTKR